MTVYFLCSKCGGANNIKLHPSLYTCYNLVTMKRIKLVSKYEVAMNYLIKPELLHINNKHMDLFD
jgi:hypothetical protein